MLDSVIRDWLEPPPAPLGPLRAMSGNMWALHPGILYKNMEYLLRSFFHTFCGFLGQRN